MRHSAFLKLHQKSHIISENKYKYTYQILTVNYREELLKQKVNKKVIGLEGVKFNKNCIPHEDLLKQE